MAEVCADDPCLVLSQIRALSFRRKERAMRATHALASLILVTEVSAGAVRAAETLEIEGLPPGGAGKLAGMLACNQPGDIHAGLWTRLLVTP
jgi:hypothetical protein